MNREINVVNYVVAFLKSHGYPDDTLILEWKISDRIIVDLAVIDPITKRPLALFEIKSEKNIDSTHAKEQIKAYAKVVEDKTIPLYIIIGKEQQPFYQIFALSETGGKDFLKPVDQMPSFGKFKKSFVVKRNNSNKRGEKKSTRLV